MTEQPDIVELLQKAAGVRSDTDAWLMIRGADEIKRQREALEALARDDGFAYATDKEKLDARIRFARAALSSGLRSPAPAEDLVDTASDIDRARRQGWAQGMIDTLKNIQAARKIQVSVKCEVCPHEEGCQLCERDGECVIIHRVTAPAPAEDGEGLREAVKELLLVIDAEMSIGPGEYISRALDKVRTALSSGRDGKKA